VIRYEHRQHYVSFATGAGNVHYISLHSLKTGLVRLGLIIFILGVCFSDAGIDFMTNIFCSQMSESAFKEKVLSIDEPKAHSI